MRTIRPACSPRKTRPCCCISWAAATGSRPRAGLPRSPSSAAAIPRHKGKSTPASLRRRWPGRWPSSPAWPWASTARRMKARYRARSRSGWPPLPSSARGPIASIRRATAIWPTASPGKACWSANTRLARRQWLPTFPSATASSPAFRWVRSWWRQRCNRVRSSRRGWLRSRAKRSSPSPAPFTARSRAAATPSSARAPSWWKPRKTFWKSCACPPPGPRPLHPPHPRRPPSAPRRQPEGRTPAC